MSEKMGPIISTNGLVFCVDAANPQSIVSGQTIWKDLTFNTTGVTLFNGVGFSGSGINSSLSFDGTNDYGLVARPSQIITGGEISINMWASWVTVGTTTSTIQALVDNKHSNAPVQGFIIQDRPDLSKSLTFSVKPDSSGAISTFQVGNGNMCHIAGTYSLNGPTRLYINGSLNAQISGETMSTVQPNISLGYWQNNPSRYLNGKIPQTLIYSRSLSPFEVYQNYNATKGRYGIPDIVTGGLVLNLDAGNPYSYNPDNTGSTVWTDVSYTSTGGTLVNGTYYTGGTMTFDGVDDLVTGTFSYTFNTGWSVEIWVYVDSRVSYPDDEGIWRVSLNNNNRLNLRRSNTSTNSWRYEVTGPNGTTGTGGMEFNATTDGVWSQIICTYNGSNSLKVYHNNTLVKTGTFNIGSVPVSTYNIGVNFGPYLQGDVAAFRVYNRELSATEVQQNFNALRGRYGI
jgi:hypothetical protein